MRQQQLGEQPITSVGCGDVRLATSAARHVDASEVARALHTALELGITLIEASEEEAAERMCGEAVRALRLRDRAIVAVRVPELSLRPGAPRRDVLPERLPIAYVQQRIEASLRATRLDVLPLAQLSLRAAWRASTAWPELAGTCARLVREGKVMHWGAWCEGGDAAEADAALASEPWLAAISIPYSVCEGGPAIEALIDAAKSGGASLAQDVASDASAPAVDPLILAAAAAAPAAPGSLVLALLGGSPGLLGGGAGGIAAPAEGAADGAAPAGPPPPAAPKLVLARRPLAGGALAGTLGPSVKLPPQDDRRALGDAALERIAVLAAKLAPLVEREPLAARSCEAAQAALERGRRPAHVEALTLAELALRYVLDRGAVALPRLHRAENVAEAIAAAAAAPLSEELRDRLAHLARDT